MPRTAVIVNPMEQNMRISFDLDTTTDMTALARIIAALSPAPDAPVAAAPIVPGHPEYRETVEVVVPPPPPVAAIVPPPPPVAVAGEQTDATGALWDAALHSSTKAILADGTWRKKRNGPAVPLVPPAPAVTESPAVAVTTVPSPPPPVAGGPNQEFIRLIRDVNQRGMSFDQLQQTAVAIGLAKLDDLREQRPDMIPTFRQTLGLDA